MDACLLDTDMLNEVLKRKDRNVVIYRSVSTGGWRWVLYPEDRKPLGDEPPPPPQSEKEQAEIDAETRMESAWLTYFVDEMQAFAEEVIPAARRG